MVYDDSDSGNPADENGTNEDPTVTPLTPMPSIEIIKSSFASGFEEGDLILYNFLVINDGNMPLSNVTIDDAVLGVFNLPVIPGSLDPGDIGFATASYTITQADINAGAVINTATATGTAPDGSTVTDDSDSGK